MRFLQGECSDTRKIALAKLENIEKPLKMGGLELGNILENNLTLLVKQWWRFSNEAELLCNKLLISIQDFETQNPQLITS